MTLNVAYAACEERFEALKACQWRWPRHVRNLKDIRTDRLRTAQNRRCSRRTGSLWVHWGLGK
eukprot:3688696-Pleurochrysis_carterae.AAC.1